MIARTAFLASLLSSVWALEQAACSTNACLHVVESNKAAPSSLARAGCTSFLHTAVTPTPVTKYVTAYTTSTVSTTKFKTLTVHRTAHSEVNDIVIDTATFNAYETVIVEDDVTQTVPGTVEVTGFTEVDTVTDVAATYTVTETTTVDAGSTTTPDTITTTLLLPRVIETSASSCGAAHRPTNVLPTYATSACNAAAYTSACACIGATPTTTTLPACTTTVTRTSTVTSIDTITHSTYRTLATTVASTLHSTATVTVTDDQVTTVTSTSVTDVTTFATIVATATVDTTVEATAATTIDVTVTGCPATPAPTQSFYLANNPDGSGTYAVNSLQEGFAVQSSPGSIFNLDDNSNLIYQDNGFVANQHYDPNVDIIYWDSAVSLAANAANGLWGGLVCQPVQLPPPSCQMTLSCSAQGNTQFAYGCFGAGYLFLTPDEYGTCTPQTLYMIDASDG